MEERRVYWPEELAGATYRDLQQVSKAMNLPSNFKKMYLIDLILAKQNGSAEQVNSIMEKVRVERQQLSQTSRKRKRMKTCLQGAEVSSTNMAQSPAISVTSNRHAINMCSLEQIHRYRKASNSHKRKRHSGLSFKNCAPKSESDRVLRSSNIKRYKNTVQNIYATIGVIEGTSFGRDNEDKEQMCVVCPSGEQYKMNLTTKCVVKNSPCVVTTRKSVYNTFHLSDQRDTTPAILQKKLTKTYPVMQQESQLKNVFEVIHRTTINNRCNYQSVQETTKIEVEGTKTTDCKISKRSPYIISCKNPLKRIFQTIPRTVYSYAKHYPLIKNQETQTKSNYGIQKMKSSQGSSTSFLRQQDTRPKSHCENAKNYTVSQYETLDKNNYEAILNFANNIPEIRIQKSDVQFEQNSVQVRQNAQTTAAGIDCPNVEVRVQDIINSNIDYITFSNPNVSECVQTNSNINYPSTSSVRVSQRKERVRNTTDNQEEFMKNTPANSSVHIPNQEESLVNIPNNQELFKNYTSTNASDAILYQEESVNNQEVLIKNASGNIELFRNETAAFEPKFEQQIEQSKDFTEPFSVYYHKKIRAEQVRNQRMLNIPVSTNAQCRKLPNIGDVFSKFKNIRKDLTQPLYVQVSEGSERTQSYPTLNAKPELLETIYNIKVPFLTGLPNFKTTTATASTCVYSTPVMSTGVQPSTSLACNEQFHASSLNVPNIGRSMTVESMESQELGSDVSIPEMVEDALEIISQDGDYLERIGMDVRMQCILCDWAGPKIILEYHIREEHADKIHQQPKNEWNITYKLGSLVNQDLWLSEVCEHKKVLYALSVKYEDPDGFMACVSTLSYIETPKTASITIYNKVTGEPHTWQGQLQELPTNMPYENDSSCLKVQLSKLDLLPNSANLKLMNRELVLKSPTKVVVGQTELNDIHIIMFVNIF